MKSRKCACGCPDGTPLFMFPDESRPETAERRKQWLRLLDVKERSDNESKRLFACYRHFSIKVRSGKRLYRNALPDANIKLSKDLPLTKARKEAGFEINLSASNSVLQTKMNTTRLLPVASSSNQGKSLLTVLLNAEKVEPSSSILNKTTSTERVEPPPPIDKKTTSIESVVPIAFVIPKKTPSMEIVKPPSLIDQKTAAVGLLLCHEEMPIEYNEKSLMAIVGRQVQTEDFLSANTPRKQNMRNHIQILKEKLKFLEKELKLKEKELVLRDNALRIKDTQLKIQDEKLKIKDYDIKILKMEKENLLAKTKKKK